MQEITRKCYSRIFLKTNQSTGTSWGENNKQIQSKAFFPHFEKKNFFKIAICNMESFSLSLTMHLAHYVYFPDLLMINKSLYN